MAESTTPIRISPFCLHLCTKKALFNTTPARTEAELLDGSGRSWCRCTMQSIGPDGQLVDPEDCRQGRDCFEGHGPRP